MKKRSEVRVLLAGIIMMLSLTVLSGCATNRGFMKLDVPEMQAAQAAAGKQIFIRAVLDKREFQEAPRDPSIPSLGFEGATGATEEIKKRAIARKRNTFGQALGDILLEEGQTVETVVRDLVSKTLRGMGYAVAEKEKDAGADIMTLDVTIRKFWAWFTPGFWSIATEGRIETDIEVSQGDKKEKLDVKAYAVNRAQTANTGTWRNLFNLVFEDYQAKMKSEFMKTESRKE